MSAPEMHALVRASSHDLASIVGDVERWLAQRVGPLTEEARQANRLAELAITASTITTVPDLAQALGVSTRTVNRLTTKYVGLPPYSMIRRRSLQEAAEWIRDHPDEALADTAIRFGFVDQAHLSREVSTLLGLPLKGYRQRAARTK